MAHGRQVVDLVRLDLLDDADQVGGVGQVPVVELELDVRVVRVLIEVVDPVGIEQGSPALDAVDLITFGQQQFSQVGAVLAGDAGDERASGRGHVQIYNCPSGVTGSDVLPLSSWCSTSSR